MDNMSTLAATALVTGAAAEVGVKAVDMIFDSAKAFFPDWKVLKENKNFTQVCIKISQYWRQNGIPEEQCHELAERLQLVYIPVAVTEEDPNLQEMLAVLAAKASVPNFSTHKIHYGFIDVIKSMDPFDAIIVKWIRLQGKSAFSRQAVLDALKDPSHDEKLIDISLNNLQRLMLITFSKLSATVTIQSRRAFLFDPDSFALTSFGSAFLDVCFN